MNKPKMLFLTLLLLASPPKAKTVIRPAQTPSAVLATPQVPDDVTRIYFLTAEGKLSPLPYESPRLDVDPYAVAQEDKTTDVVLVGSHATAVIKNRNPAFYVFVADRMDPPPHMLVRLAGRKSSRRLAITTQKGRKGYQPFINQVVRLNYRILERLRVDAGKGRILFINFMEISPKQQLEPGEYAVVGNSLAQMATFHIE